MKVISYRITAPARINGERNERGGDLTVALNRAIYTQNIACDRAAVQRLLDTVSSDDIERHQLRIDLDISYFDFVGER